MVALEDLEPAALEVEARLLHRANTSIHPGRIISAVLEQ